jgi:hypothetical protein
MRNLTRSCLALSCAALLAACGGGGSDGDATGALNLKITDSPVDEAEKVVVVFTGIELKPRDGQAISIDVDCVEDTETEHQECVGDNAYLDLLNYQDGATFELLDGRRVDAGEYEWIRLKVLAEMNNSSGSYIKLLDGSEYPLFIPSGSETGLKLVRPFTVAQGGTTRLVIDFDIRKSVIAPPGLAPNYILKPTLRLMDELETGTIEGVVDLAALGAEQEAESCDGGVYLFNGAGATPDDADGVADDGADPVVYRSLVAAEGSTAASYSFPFVEAGAYTIAFTCDFAVDASPEESEYDPGAADGEPGFETMRWTTADVTVAADQTEVVDFPFPTT